MQRGVGLLGMMAMVSWMSGCAVSGQGGDGSVASKVLGTWKLVSVVREEVPSGVKTDLFGPNPEGYINYGPDGRMMVIIVRSGRSKPVGTIATSAEAEALFRSMNSYAGRYTISGNELTHHVDISWNQAWTGTRQLRIAKFEGDRVTLSTPLSPDPLDGKMSIRSLVWERLK